MIMGLGANVLAIVICKLGSRALAPEIRSMLFEFINGMVSIILNYTHAPLIADGSLER